MTREIFLKDMDEFAKKQKIKHNRSQSPSAGSHPSSFRDQQEKENTRIACGRPRDVEETIPSTLLHPAFGQFIDDCKNNRITEEDNAFIHELANVNSALYENEDKRIAAVSKVLAAYRLGFRLHSRVQGTAYQTDADMSIDVRGNCHSFVIAEFKNEAATSSSEPYVQALNYYLESTRNFAPQMSGSALPCFILILFGQSQTDPRHSI